MIVARCLVLEWAGVLVVVSSFHTRTRASTLHHAHVDYHRPHAPHPR